MSNEQKVRELAYLKWEKAGYPAGDGVKFWAEAEREIIDKTLAAEMERVYRKTTSKEPTKVAAKVSPKKR